MTTPLFTPRLNAARARLEAFAPLAGRHYAAERNRDSGPERRDNVSLLSPYIRHRALAEHEVLAAVLQHHTPETAEKFIQEVFWRTYWKGWLQMRPQVWRSFLDECAAQRERLEHEPGLRAAVTAAEQGRTGVEGFDDWAHELVQTGYLHNHARMWFASIWIFTLQLPWTLGADFFLRHLLDADPATNTLGWRWVAGIQTPGKTYRADADNIARFSNHRFRPSGLARETHPLPAEAPPSPAPLSAPRDLPAGEPVLLLLHGDDLCGDAVLPAATRVAAVRVAAGGHTQHPWPFGAPAAEWVTCLAADAADHARHTRQCPSGVLPGLDAAALRQACVEMDLRVVATPEAPVGPVADGLERVARELAAEGIELVPLRRRWDALAWPHATHGFFRFKRQIPELLAANGLL
ncbi:FAD-binding domain-containing protein [Thioalkalivibrio sp. ALJ16]|uniref:FAD-binding domain-containing protein n=1 Tax=Thioalkalivibrio sp. ALJ16 TaxID=1158762 RepID=UPI00035D679B|nr:FAD-binding domain-containing protein [Thioalkalivibrio sp. ALJ16]